MITKAQMCKIYATAKELNMDGEMLHDFVLCRTDKQHISDLSLIEAKHIIDEMVRMGGTASTNHRPAPGMITQEQINKISVLERELGWKDDPKRLKGFIKKYAHCENLSWLKVWQASNVIEGLKKVLGKQLPPDAEADIRRNEFRLLY